MNRLQSELHRLYLPPPSKTTDPGIESPSLTDAAGRTRALVMELTDPADWDALSPVWRGVQSDFQFPAPAIAVSGTDALQLWFSLSEPIEAPRAAAFLGQLRARYLPDLPPGRVRLLPSATEPHRHAALVPAQQEPSGNWSAFVAPDLAPVFADTPWLDIPPGAEGQADLLARLESAEPAAFEAAMQRLMAVAVERSSAAPAQAGTDRHADGDAADLHPKRFLQQVLNDPGAPLALRIEAAKALLPYAEP